MYPSILFVMTAETIVSNDSILCFRLQYFSFNIELFHLPLNHFNVWKPCNNSWHGGFGAPFWEVLSQSFGGALSPLEDSRFSKDWYKIVCAAELARTLLQTSMNPDWFVSKLHLLTWWNWNQTHWRSWLSAAWQEVAERWIRMDPVR